MQYDVYLFPRPMDLVLCELLRQPLLPNIWLHDSNARVFEIAFFLKLVPPYYSQMSFPNNCLLEHANTFLLSIMLADSPTNHHRQYGSIPGLEPVPTSYKYRPLRPAARSWSVGNKAVLIYLYCHLR